MQVIFLIIQDNKAINKHYEQKEQNMRLVGDIGGTNVRFAVSDKAGKISNLRVFAKNEHKNISEAIIKYIDLFKVSISECKLAINAPTKEGMPFINHNNWGYDEDIKTQTSIDDIVFYNDLYAHSLSLPFLEDKDKSQIYGATAQKNGTIAIIGPGTGLGASYGVFDGKKNQYKICPSEAGNQIASFVDANQKNILDGLGICPIRWEDVCSGVGISNIYKALFAKEKTTEDIMADLASGSKEARQAFEHFCNFLGVFAHNMSEAFLPFGGIYILGGIFSRVENSQFLQYSSQFVDYFSSNKIYANTQHIVDIPIYVISNKNTALIGLSGI